MTLRTEAASATTAAFPGFPPEAMKFLGDLRANNNRDWFTAHRALYDAAIRGPAEALIGALSEPLEALAGRLLATKIFRINRDVRFSKDKSPYNAHLHIGFSARAGEAQPSWGFYFGLEPDSLHLGAGAFEFPGRALDRYRAATADDHDGAALSALLAKLAASGFRIGDPDLKRVPAPYVADHPRGELLRHKGLSAWREIADRNVIESPALIEATMGAFETLAPLNRWIEAAVEAD